MLSSIHGIMIIPTVLMSGLELLQQSGGGGGGAIMFFIIFLAIFLIPAIGLWKTFNKAGKPGWGAFIPVLNLFYLLDIADKPTWWIILFFVPVINFFVSIVVTIDVAKNFNKGAGFGIALVVLPFIFWPVLGFGDAEYVGDTSAGV